MARRYGIVDANHFDFANCPVELGSTSVRHDSTTQEPGKRRSKIQFDGIDGEEAGSQRRKTTFDFGFGAQGLSHKGSIARFFNQREEQPHPEAASRGKQLKRKRGLSSLNLSARADAAAPSAATSAAPPEDSAVKSLRKSLSRAALHLGRGKREHAEAELPELDDSRPRKRLRLPEIDAQIPRWSRTVERAFDGVERGVERESYVQQQSGIPYDYAARRRQYEVDQTPTPPIPPRSARRPFPYTQGAQPLDVKQVNATALARLEGRRMSQFDSLAFQQFEGFCRSGECNIHPACRHRAFSIAEAGDRENTQAFRSLQSRARRDKSRLDSTLFSLGAELDGTMRQQFDGPREENADGRIRAKKRKLRAAVRDFESWDDFARQIAEQ